MGRRRATVTQLTKPRSLTRDSVLRFAQCDDQTRCRDRGSCRQALPQPLQLPLSHKPMPFDMKRFSYGGFEVVVDV
jgi:uncharacterized protein YbaA (DUF1428 family)